MGYVGGDDMKFLSAALIYLGFFTLVGGAVYLTGSAWCLWALVLSPTLSFKSGDDKAST